MPTKQLGKWIGRIDPDGRYSLYREKTFVPKWDSSRFVDTADKWAVYVHVCGLLHTSPDSPEEMDGRRPSLPYLPLVLRAQRALAFSVAEGEIDPKGLGSSKALTPRKRFPRGLRGITAHGRRTVRNGVRLLESRYGKDQMAFATLTFPRLREEDWGNVLENWSKCLDNFQRRLREFLQRKGLPGDLVGCVEIQSKRRESWGDPALHLHIVFQARRKGKGWVLTPKKLRELWKNAWVKVLRYGYDWSAAENLQRVVKSAERYLAKYLSKGCNLVSEPLSSGELIVVPSWYVCSNRLRLAIRENTMKSYSIGSYLANAVKDDKDMFSWMSYATYEARDGNIVTVCYFGSIKDWRPEYIYPEGM